MHPNEYRKLRTPEAAAFLSVSVSTLTKWRVYGKGPSYEKIGQRVVVYDPAELREFAARGMRRSTSDPGHTAHAA